MGKTGNWSYSDIHPLYTSGGNVKQTPRSKNVIEINPDNTLSNSGTKLSTPSTAKYQGWSNEGIKRFNSIFGLIEAERNTSSVIKFEEEFLVYSVTHQESNKKSKKKKTWYTKLVGVIYTRKVNPV